MNTEVNSHLRFPDLQHPSFCQDAQIGRLCHHPAILVPGDGRWRHGVGLALQSDGFPHEDVHHQGGVAAAVPDTWRDWKKRCYLSVNLTGQVFTCLSRVSADSLKTVRWMCLCASPAAFMATQLYFPPSDTLAFRI